MQSKRGSIRVFIREDQRFTVHEPHGKGDPFVSKQARKRAIEVLDALDLLDK